MITSLTVRLILLLFPGVICTYIVDALTAHRPRTPFFFGVQSLILGLGAYLVYWLGLRSLGLFIRPLAGRPVVFLDALADANTTINYSEVAWACLAAVVLGIAVVTFINRKFLTRAAGVIGVSNQIGELDVWGRSLNVSGGNWVTVRDHRNDVMYDGWVDSFSDDSRDAELLLRDVAVYKNSTGEHLYDVGAMYLSLERDSIAMEFRDVAVGSTPDDEEASSAGGEA